MAGLTRLEQASGRSDPSSRRAVGTGASPSSGAEHLPRQHGVARSGRRPRRPRCTWRRGLRSLVAVPAHVACQLAFQGGRRRCGSLACDNTRGADVAASPVRPALFSRRYPCAVRRGRMRGPGRQGGRGTSKLPAPSAGAKRTLARNDAALVARGRGQSRANNTLDFTISAGRPPSATRQLPLGPKMGDFGHERGRP